MAEPDKKHRDNPFSFKKFVNRKDSISEEDGKDLSDEDIDIFAIPDKMKQRKRDKQKQILVVEEELPKSKPKKKGKSENPFSIKTFLSGSTGVKPSACDKSEDINVLKDRIFKPHVNTSSSLPAGSLPDFVQDHYSEIPGASSDLFSSVSDQNLEHAEMSPDLGDRQCVWPKDSASTDSSIQYDDEFSTEDGQRTIEDDSRGNTLPDFLSDTAMGGCIKPVCDGDIFENKSGTNRIDRKSDDESKFVQLKQENTQIRKQLQYSKSKMEQDAKRILELEQQLTNQKKKEEEETEAMDRAMEQVEANLSETTKRAMQAENTVTKLKQELKSLQADMKALRTENTVLRAGDKYVLDIKEKTVYVAGQLSTATKNAENSLRQMLNGLDQLKLMSQVLNSVDKISEENSYSEQSGGPTLDGT